MLQTAWYEIFANISSFYCKCWGAHVTCGGLICDPELILASSDCAAAASPWYYQHPACDYSYPPTSSCCLTGGVSSQVSVMLMRIVDKPIWFWVWYHPSLQRALKFVIILWFSFIRFKMLTFSIKISCKYLDYNKEMFCAYEIDIYHVYQRATHKR